MENFINNAPFALVLVALVIGFVLLIKGADYFVEGSSSVAKRLHVPAIIIGLTIVAMGTAAAILVLNGLAVLAGGLVSEFIPEWLIKIVAAFAFLYFAASTLAGDEDEEEEEGGKSKIKFAPLAVFCTFFVAELGDKTQLTAITFGANEGMGAAFIVWIGCSLGLFLADILGMLVGYLLKSKTPDGLLNTLAFVIFAIFGIYTAYQALNLISESVCPITVWPLLAAVTVAFVVICVWLYMKKKKGQDVSADKG